VCNLDGGFEQHIRVGDGAGRDRPSYATVGRYDALTEHLRSRFEPVVEMTFAELDRVAGGLPPSARRHAAWWSNTRTGQAHASAWLDAGRRAQPDFNGGCVRFTLGAETIPRPRGENSRMVNASTLEPTGESLAAAVSYQWVAAGPITTDGSPKFPPVPTAPGVYRITLTALNGQRTVYVGEAVSVSRRFAGYRNPGPTQPTNRRLHALLLELIAAGGTADVALVLNAEFDGRPLDLRSTSARQLIGKRRSRRPCRPRRTHRESVALSACRRCHVTSRRLDFGEAGGRPKSTARAPVTRR
jgi:hypothetical protein